MKMEFENLIRLIDAVSKSDLTGFEYEEGGVKLNLKKEKEQMQVVAAPVMPSMAVESSISAMATPATTGVQTESVLEGNVVESPLVGTFYAAPAEDAAPFVSVGDTVKKGQTLAIVEAMKLMNEIESEYDGTVAEVLVNNGEAVEYGQPLFRIV